MAGDPDVEPREVDIYRENYAAGGRSTSRLGAKSSRYSPEEEEQRYNEANDEAAYYENMGREIGEPSARSAHPSPRHG